MKKPIMKPIPKDVDFETKMKFEVENANIGLEVLEENLPEIREIFRVQLDKPGHVYREFAVEEIIKYLYTHRVEKYKNSKEEWGPFWAYSYARTIYELADIIKAANEGDEKAFDEAMKSLPWGDSNTGDQISWNTTCFAYGIMSNEAREKFGPIVYGYIERSNDGKRNASAKFAEMAELEFLPNLVEFNQATAKEIESMKKQSQPGDGE